MATILVIDDDITIQLTLKRILLKQGYDVDIASDGESGLKTAIALQPAVIVCDWMMPGMKGPEVCQRVREYPELNATFFILLTAFDSVEDIVRGLDAGADDFLTKPPDIAELKARIRTGCRSFELKRALQLKTQELDVGLRATAEYLRSLLPPSYNHAKISFSRAWHPCLHLDGTGIFGHWLDEDTFAFGLLEAAKTGIDAALQVARSLASLPTVQVDDTGHQLDRILAALEQQLRERSSEGAFSIWYGIFCPSDKTLTYCSAGNTVAVVVNSRGRVTPLANQRPALGAASTVTDSSLELQDASQIGGTEFTFDSRPLKSGNTLYLLNSSIVTGSQPFQAERIQWLLDAESQTTGDRVLAVAIENLRRACGSNTSTITPHTNQALDTDIALVRVRVH
ncbi:MAG: response regulator [Cyanobacteria bacterium J06597_1]